MNNGVVKKSIMFDKGDSWDKTQKQMMNLKTYGLLGKPIKMLSAKKTRIKTTGQYQYRWDIEFEYIKEDQPKQPENVIISGGATMFRKYVLDVKRANHQTGIHKKMVKKKDENGIVYWQKEYYYQKVERPEEEKQKLIAKGNDPKSTHANYKDKYIGIEKPEGYLEDELSTMHKANLFTLKGKDLICSKDILEKLQAIAPDYFTEPNVSIYVLK